LKPTLRTYRAPSTFSRPVVMLYVKSPQPMTDKSLCFSQEVSHTSAKDLFATVLAGDAPPSVRDIHTNKQFKLESQVLTTGKCTEVVCILVVASKHSMLNCERGSAASGVPSGPLNQYCKSTRPESRLPAFPRLATLHDGNHKDTASQHRCPNENQFQAIQ
jgi:hypothetical protein